MTTTPCRACGHRPEDHQHRTGRCVKRFTEWGSQTPQTCLCSYYTLERV